MKVLFVTLQLWTHAIMNLSKPIEYATPKVFSIVNYGLLVITTRQCRFIVCNKGTTLAGNVDNGGAYASERAGVCRNLCTFLSDLL